MFDFSTIYSEFQDFKINCPSCNHLFIAKPIHFSNKCHCGKFEIYRICVNGTKNWKISCLYYNELKVCLVDDGDKILLMPALSYLYKTKEFVYSNNLKSDISSSQIKKYLLLI